VINRNNSKKIKIIPHSTGRLPPSGTVINRNNSKKIKIIPHSTGRLPPSGTMIRRPVKTSLSKQIGISLKSDIPVTLLNKIISAKIGDTITNPTKTGKRRIKVTLLLKRRANSVRKPLLR